MVNSKRIQRLSSNLNFEFQKFKCGSVHWDTGLINIQRDGSRQFSSNQVSNKEPTMHLTFAHLLFTVLVASICTHRGVFILLVFSVFFSPLSLISSVPSLA